MTTLDSVLAAERLLIYFPLWWAKTDSAATLSVVPQWAIDPDLIGMTKLCKNKHMRSKDMGKISMEWIFGTQLCIGVLAG